jgi:hypothetical protein
MARIAMFLARSPGAPMTGRKAVLRTAISALAQEGHTVHLFILAKRDSAAQIGEAQRAVWLGTPSRPLALRNAALSLLGQGGSLNEALFRSARLLARVCRDCKGYDYAIADTIRAAPYASALGVPWHLDLDDLFSARYDKYLEHPAQLSAALILGYYRDSAPRVARMLPRAVLRRLLAREAASLRRRETYWAGKATSVSLVSPDEAESFSRSTARRVHSLPMSVPVPAVPWKPSAAQGGAGVFLGGLDYKPNLDALLYYQSAIFPLLRGLRGVGRLSHIGNAPPELRARFAPEAVHFEGYVDDVVARLRRATFFVAPVVSGTGIKTKVLEAMAVGLPVLATRDALTGLKVEHERHCFVCERPGRFADGLRFLGDAGAAERMGLQARGYVEENFSLGVLRRRWNEVIEGLAGKPCSSS